MVTVFDRHWWILALRGLVALLFGIGIVAWPAVTLAALVPLFAAYALGDGLLALMAAVWAARWHVSWWPLLVEGAIDVAAGLVVLVWPNPPLFALIYFVAVWAALTGGFAILAAVLLRREMAGDWLLFLSGAGSVLLGALLLMFPGAGVLGVVWLIAGYWLIGGLLMLGFALRLRDWRRRRAPAESGWHALHRT